MKSIAHIALLAILPGLAFAEAEDPLAKHREGSEKIAVEQDELSADVQQLVMEQTIQEVIDLLGEVEDIMTEATDLLVEHDTGGQTLAAQTEVIEKIYEAAKEKQKQSGSGQSGGAMQDMLERMMGQGEGQGEGEGEGKGKGKGEGQGEGEGEGEGEGGNQGGKGQTGDSNTANSQGGGSSTEFTEERRVPKAAGTAGRALPPEFRSALDAYNRGMENLGKP